MSALISSRRCSVFCLFLILKRIEGVEREFSRMLFICLFACFSRSQAATVGIKQEVWGGADYWAGRAGSEWTRIGHNAKVKGPKGSKPESMRRSLRQGHYGLCFLP